MATEPCEEKGVDNLMLRLAKANIVLFEQNSARRRLVAELFHAVDTFSTMTSSCWTSGNGFIVGPSGVGKTEIMKVFVKEVHNFFKNIDSMFIDAAESEIPLRLSAPPGRKLFVVIDNMDHLYLKPSHLPLLWAISGIIQGNANVLVIGFGSNEKLQSLLKKESFPDDNKFSNLKEAPKLNRRKFNSFSSRLHNALWRSQFDQIATVIAPERYCSFSNEERTMLMWITGGNGARLHEVLRKQTESSVHSVSRLIKVVVELWDAQSRLDAGEQRAFRKMMNKINRRNLGKFWRLRWWWNAPRLFECCLDGLVLDPFNVKPAKMPENPALDSLAVKGFIVRVDDSYYPGVPLFIPMRLFSKITEATWWERFWETKFMFLAPSAARTPEVAQSSFSAL